MKEAISTTWECSLCPQAPEFHLDWEGGILPLSWMKPMIGCKQDPIHHAEGDVATHVRLVCKALVASAPWRQLDAQARAALFLAAVLHDVAKPECTVENDDGHISSAGHGQKGAQRARQILWRGDGFRDNPAPLSVRETVSNMVRYSSLPLWLWDKENPAFTLIRASQSVRLDWLALLAEADSRGRTCQDLDNLLSRIELFRQCAEEQECWAQPYGFASDHSRFIFFHNRSNSDRENYAKREIYDDTRFQVTLMSGLPGSGKDQWIAANMPSARVVSLDKIRKRLGVDPSQNQNQVVLAARQEAREHMRKSQSFVWNATNVTRFLRDPLIRFFRDYGARVRIVYVEPPSFEALLKRNAQREKAVAAEIVEKLADKLEVPDLTEAHELLWVCE